MAREVLICFLQYGRLWLVFEIRQGCLIENAYLKEDRLINGSRWNIYNVSIYAQLILYNETKAELLWTHNVKASVIEEYSVWKSQKE